MEESEMDGGAGFFSEGPQSHFIEDEKEHSEDDVENDRSCRTICGAIDRHAPEGPHTSRSGCFIEEPAWRNEEHTQTERPPPPRIKVEPPLREDGSTADPAQTITIKGEPAYGQKVNLPYGEVYSPAEYLTICIKEESMPYDEDHADTEWLSPEQTPNGYASPGLKEESALSDIYTQEDLKHIEYTSVLVKEEFVPCEDHPDMFTEATGVFNNCPEYDIRHMDIADPVQSWSRKTQIHARNRPCAGQPASCREEDLFAHADESDDGFLLRDKRTNRDDKSFVCPDCGKGFTCNSNLVIHQRIHTGERPFSCSECGQCFSNKSNLITHHRIHTGEKPFLCSECGKCFSRKTELVSHHKIHTGEKPYACSECGKDFLRRSELVKHVRVHTGEKPFACPECDKCFSSKSNLSIHQRIHTGEKHFSCSQCGKCFASKSYLVTHQRTHTGEKPYLCVQCGKYYSSSANLITHQKIHRGEKPFSCPECLKCFSTKANLATHQRTHSGEKPFPCPECGKCFSNKSVLIIHRRIHTGTKRFSCPECGKCFTDKSNMVQHQRIHTGEKPYSCSDCGKFFSSKLGFVKHQKLHAREKLHLVKA